MIQTRANRLLVIGLCLLALLYALQIFSPLRLNTDAQHFLTCAAQAADSPATVPIASSKPHPPGYATLLAVLDRAKLAGPASFFLVNLAGIALGCGAVFFLLRRVGEDDRTALVIVGLTLLSFVLIKHATIPLSDLPFFGVSLACLWLLTRSGEEVRWPLIAGAFILALLAIGIRTIGVALLPAVLWAACGKRRRLAAGLLLGGGILGALALSQTAYAGYALRQFASGEALRTIPLFRLQELAEVALNLPASRVGFVPLGFFYGAGALVLLVLALGVAKWKYRGTLEIYFLAFSGVLFVWPFEDARFWLPILPLFLLFLWKGLGGLPWSGRCGWIAIYVALGISALVYSTRLTFSGSDFANRYGNGAQRAAYQAALLGAPAEEADPEVLTILRRYESRAHQR